MRLIFMLNIRFIKTVIVQSDITKDYLEKSYPFLEGKIEVILLPAPSWLKPKKKSVRKKRIGLTLFYPSAGYPYKNHKIINKMYKAKAKTEKLDTLLITLNNSEMKSGIHDISWVGNLGRLNNKSCMDMYQKADALFFPSLLESYGLPLLEAMVLGLPILCSDLPYARWMCEDQAIYFDPFNPASAWDAVDDLFERLNEGWNVVWEKPLSKFPKEWDEVAVRYKNILFD